MRQDRGGRAVWARRAPDDRLAAVNTELDRLRGWDWTGVHIPQNPPTSPFWEQIPESGVHLDQFVCWVQDS